MSAAVEAEGRVGGGRLRRGQGQEAAEAAEDQNEARRHGGSACLSGIGMRGPGRAPHGVAVHEAVVEDSVGV